MKALKASIRIAATALALSLALGAPSRAAEDEASTLTLQMKELYQGGKYTEALPRHQGEEFGPGGSRHGAEQSGRPLPRGRALCAGGADSQALARHSRED